MLKKTCQCLILMIIGIMPTTAQQQKVALPTVTGASVPLYPPLARVARVQGIVRLKVSTDGYKVTTINVIEGHQLLAAAAEENARSWRFALHESTTFNITYHYILNSNWKGDPYNPTVILRLPTEVEISTALVPLQIDY